MLTKTIEPSQTDELAWPCPGVTRVPYRVFRDEPVYAAEQERIFLGATWNFLCLEAEIPNLGDFKTTVLGGMPVVVVRGEENRIHAFENRCSHRGSLLVLKNYGNARDFTCVYHAWRHDLEGNLCGVAFQRGVKGKGGMSPDFRMAEHGPRKLRVATLGGLVFGTLSAETPELEIYLGPQIVQRMTRVLKNRLVPLGSFVQVIPNNWKLYFENAKDSYHSSILHVFFTTFKIVRLSYGGGIILDESGGHHVSYTVADGMGPDKDYDQAKLRSNREDDFLLADPSILKVVDEVGDACNNQILSVFPNLVLHQIQNSLAVRQIVPKSVDKTHLVWTFFGLEDDTDELRELRLKHANLVGPAGYVSMEDGAVGGFVQRGINACGDQASVIEMGGHGTESQDFRTTEVSVRGFWKAYRRHMGV